MCTGCGWISSRNKHDCSTLITSTAAWYACLWVNLLVSIYEDMHFISRAAPWVASAEHLHQTHRSPPQPAKINAILKVIIIIFQSNIIQARYHPCFNIKHTVLLCSILFEKNLNIFFLLMNCYIFISLYFKRWLEFLKFLLINFRGGMFFLFLYVRSVYVFVIFKFFQVSMSPETEN